MTNEKENISQASEVREPVAAYVARTDTRMQWKYDPRQLIPLEQIEAVARRIAERFSVEKILLFGSYAYGEPEEGSDVDLLVVMDTEKRPSEIRYEMYSLLEDFTAPIDIVVKGTREVESAMRGRDWFLRDILTKGRVLYG
ncbi:MAG: nucleotidyltransferase domain-containing protein [Bacteroidota bacterium]